MEKTANALALLRQASFIRQADDFGDVVPVFKKTVWADKPVSRAILHVTALGFYEAYLNSARVGRFIFAPGWTSYRTRLQVQSYDVTELTESCNVLEIAVGRGRRFHDRKDEELPDLPGRDIALIAALEITYEDGTGETVFTDETWTCAKSNVLYSDIYNGETVDYNAPTDGDLPVRTVDVPKEILILTEGEESREMARLPAVELITTPKGETVLDFGQEITGYVEWKVPEKQGAEFVIYHAEFLDKDGNFYTENLRSAKCEIHVISDGRPHLYKPRFTFQGFRYIKLVGFDADVNLEDFNAIVVFSDMKRTGFFACGDELVQQLYENVVWGQRGNFLDVPTDCPQRDERLGWTGDAQVFARTASFTYDTRRFFRKWLHDLAADQRENGAVPHVVPRVWDGQGSAAWGDACTIVPWQVYLAYGDTSVLREQFNSMKRWVDFIGTECSEPGLWDGGSHFGDWLSLDAGDEATAGFTDDNLIATAMYANSVDITIKAGKILGEDVSAYEALYPVIVNAYRTHYLNDGKPEHETQTAQVLALTFGLTDDPARELKKLCDDIEACGHLKTGFVGAGYLLHVLSDNGRTDLAYRLLLRREFPSWLYPVTMGATTTWERWDGMKPDRSFATPAMNSFNHYAYGAVADWLYGDVAGINPDEQEPGYRHILLRPHPSKALGYAKARLLTECGEIVSSWEYTGEGDNCEFSFTVPDGSHATLYLDGETYEFESGTHHATFEFAGY